MLTRLPLASARQEAGMGKAMRMKLDGKAVPLRSGGLTEGRETPMFHM